MILYFVTAQLMYLIGKEMGFGEKKSLLCKFAFLIFPMGVFSQFIFSQIRYLYRIFMVLGFWLYLRGKLWKTALMFGIAATFKYHAVLYFLALILLKEKKIRKPDQIYGCDGAAPSRGDRPESGIGSISPERVRIRGPGVCAEIFFRGLLQRHQSHGGGCGFRSGVGIPEKSGKSGRTGFLGGVFLCGGKFFHFRIFHMESSVDPSDGAFSGSEYLINGNGNLLLMITNIFMLAMYIFSSQSMVDERVLNAVS